LKSVKLRPIYCTFSTFQDGGRRHLAAAAISDFQNFTLLTVGRLKWAEMRRLPNLVEIGQNAPDIRRFFDFSRWRPPPS